MKKVITKVKSACMLVALTVLTLTGCTGTPDNVEPVNNFELDRYLGQWYEIARLDHPFERGLSKITATYTLRDDNGVNVVNRGYNESEGEWDTANGKAYFVEGSDIGYLKVSFFGPFYASYVVMALDEKDYQYAMVTGPDRDYLWILSRTPKLDQRILDKLLAQAKAAGYPVDELIYVDH